MAENAKKMLQEIVGAAERGKGKDKKTFLESMELPSRTATAAGISASTTSRPGPISPSSSASSAPRTRTTPRRRDGRPRPPEAFDRLRWPLTYLIESPYPSRNSRGAAHDKEIENNS